MNFNDDHFALFELPRAFSLDRAALDARYRDIQALVHPDKFAHSSHAEQRRAMQWASKVNEAYQTLKKPISRATYLLQLAGFDVAAESNTAMPLEFLMAQMECREAVAEAFRARDVDALEASHAQVSESMATQYAQLADWLDDSSNSADKVAATACVRQLMFLEKLLVEVNDALADCEA